MNNAIKIHSRAWFINASAHSLLSCCNDYVNLANLAIFLISFFYNTVNDLTSNIMR